MHCQVTLTVENNEGLVHLHYAVVVHQRSKKTIMLWPNWCTVESADETMTLLPALKTRVLPPLTVGEQGLCCPVSCYQYVWHHSNAFNSFWYFFFSSNEAENGIWHNSDVYTRLFQNITSRKMVRDEIIEHGNGWFLVAEKPAAENNSHVLRYTG